MALPGPIATTADEAIARKSSYLEGYDDGIASLPPSLLKTRTPEADVHYNTGYRQGEEDRRAIEQKTGEYLERLVRRETKRTHKMFRSDADIRASFPA